MATTAIEFGRGIEFPGKTKLPKRVLNRRFLSRAVLQRNEHAARPWWQPSRAKQKTKQPRSAVLATAIAEDLDERAKSPDEFWSGDVSEEIVGVQAWPAYLDQGADYEQERRHAETLEIFGDRQAHLQRQIEELKAQIGRLEDVVADAELRLKLIDLEVELKYCGESIAA